MATLDVPTDEKPSGSRSASRTGGEDSSSRRPSFKVVANRQRRLSRFDILQAKAELVQQRRASITSVVSQLAKKAYAPSDVPRYDEPNPLDLPVSAGDKGKEFMLSTSAHGLARIASAERWWGRLLWTIIFCLCTGLFFYQAGSLLIDYLDYPVTMTIRVINQQNQLFPAITVCNQNRIKKSKLVGTRFESLPAIDKNFCACRFVGGINGQQLGAERRRKRNVEGPAHPIDELTDCAEMDFDFNTVPEHLQVKYRGRFKKDVEEFELEIKEAGYEHLYETEGDVLNEVHQRLTEPGRRFKRATTHLINNAALLEGDIDYSMVQNSSDWWGFLNASQTADYSDIADVARVSKEETKLLGHPPDEFILQCVFDQQNKCSWQDFEQFQHKKYGNCYTFNHGQRGDVIRYTSRFGSQYGLKLTLFIHQEEYIGLFTQEAGVRISIHKPHAVPFPEDHGFDARPGSITSFGIRVNEMIRTELPYGGEDCTERDRVENDVYNGHYSYIACEKACIQTTLREQCSCIDDINTLFTDVPICDILNQNQALCQKKVYQMFEANELACNCIQRCNETYYSVQYSNALWPSDQYEGYLFAGISDVDIVRDVLKDGLEDTLKNIVRLSFTLEELNKQEIAESPKYSVFDILSNIGGSLGLYIGVSIITIAEIIDFTIDMILHMCLWGRYKSVGDSRSNTPNLS